MAKIISMNTAKHTSNTAEEKKEKSGVSDLIVDFIQKNRKNLIITVISIIAALGCVIAGVGIREILSSRAISRVEALTGQYESLKGALNDPSRAEEVEALLADLGEFARKNSGYAGARAYTLIASVQGDRKNWAEAESAWLSAAKKAPKTYLAPIALFNAAAAAEEADNVENALAHYQETMGYEDQFPQAARSQFNIGRLQEGLGNREAALEAYQRVIEKWPSETVWTNLAHSKIITLTGLDP